MAINIDMIPDKVAAGGEVQLEAKLDPEPKPKEDLDKFNFTWTFTPDTLQLVGPVTEHHGPKVRMSTKGVAPGSGYKVNVKSSGPDNRQDEGTRTLEVLNPPPSPPVSSMSVRMQRVEGALTSDLALWVAIRNTTNAIGFNAYMEYIDGVMCAGKPDKALKERGYELRLPFPGVDAYSLLKIATEVFLMSNCGVHVNIDVGDLRAESFKTTGFTRYDTVEETRRLNREVNPGLIEQLWARYVDVVYKDAAIDSKNADKLKEAAVPTLPYLALIRAKLKDTPIKSEERGLADNCFGILQSKLANPCLLELIWSYWHEEGMLVQSLNAISLRFQNRRGMGDRDPLAHLELDPLRPLNNLLWGYIQDEQHRLTLIRRAYEYDHHYGLSLDGKAVGKLRPADSRSKFLEAFHNLLHVCAGFFKEDDDTMVIADGFPVLNSIKEVHLLLTQGQHNQYGDLPWNARLEMLMQAWLLARPEMREFLTSRIMVAYPEPWMERVDTMKKMQGWSDTPVTQFRDLGVFGEQILLSVRFGAWSAVHDPAQGANWARYWRPEIQSYIHAYRAVTGADLTVEPADATLPSVHLRGRLTAQKSVR